MDFKRYFIIFFVLSALIISVLISALGLQVALIEPIHAVYGSVAASALVVTRLYTKLGADSLIRKNGRGFCILLFTSFLIIYPALIKLTTSLPSYLLAIIGGVVVTAGFISIGNETVSSNISIQKNRNLPSKVFIFVLIAVFSIFVISRLLMPLFYTGSYIDEYFHILSGLNLLEHGSFAEMYSGEEYARSPYISVMSAGVIYLFGKSIFALKQIPFVIASVNFILLYIISNRIFKYKETVILCLLSYTFNPLVVLNHFYIRFNVFYEFVLLFSLYLFLKISELFISKNYKKASLYAVLVIFLDLINFVFNGDSLRYLGLLLSGIYFLVFFLTQINKETLLAKLKSSVALKILLGSAIALLLVVGFLSSNSFIQLFIGTLNDEHSLLMNDYSLNGFIFSKSLGFTLLFVSSGALLLKNRRTRMNWVYFIGYGLFALHIFSSPNLKIIRGLFYFVPLYYVISYKSLESIYSKKIHRLVLGMVLVASICLTYPNYFFEQPQIKNDLNYQDYSRTFDFVRSTCAGYTKIGLIHFPDISYFYDVKIDSTNYIFKELLEKDNKYSFNNGSYVTNFQRIPVTEEQDLLAAIGNNRESTCIITYTEYNNAYRYLKQSDFISLPTIFQEKRFTNFVVYYPYPVSSLKK